MRPALIFAGALLIACHHEPPIPKGRSWATAPVPPPATLIGRSLPRIVDRGGPLLANPRVATVTFASDDPAVVERVERFDDTITQSSWWREVVDGYCPSPERCIGAGGAGKHIRLDDTLPAALDDDTLDKLLQRRLAKEPTAETVFVVYLPPKVVLGDAFVPRYCAHDGKPAPRAYHRTVEIGGKPVPYAVLPRCSDESELTAAASHEILETTTNPDASNRGFAFEQGSSNLGFTFAGTEAVDPCGLITMDNHWITQDGYAVQRAWSNRAAAAGHDPCTPARPERPYLALVPRSPAARLPKVGDRVVVTVEAAADRDVPIWSISAFDLSGYQDHTSYVDVAFDRSTLATGETATVTITLKATNATRLSVVGLVSTLGAQSWMWPIPVVMR